MFEMQTLEREREKEEFNEYQTLNLPQTNV